MTYQDLVQLISAIACAGLCSSIIFIPIIVLRVRSTNREVSRFRAAQARGAFDDLDEPPAKSRLRLYAFIALIGTLGMIITFFILLLRIISNDAGPSVYLLAIALTFGLIGSIAGILIRREYKRRL